MKQTKNFKALGRATGVLTAVVVVVSGVTFAALQSQQVKLTGNVIQTATANLLVSPDGVNYSAAQSGFSFSSLVPGGQPMPLGGYTFFLKNGGGTPLALKFSISSTPSNPDAIDLNKINVIITPMNGGSPQSFTLAALIAANTTGGATILTPNALMPGLSAQYTLQVSMTSDAITGSSASMGNIDFAFTGLAQSN
jgi:hypothetical protein